LHQQDQNPSFSELEHELLPQFMSRQRWKKLFHYLEKRFDGDHAWVLSPVANSSVDIKLAQRNPVQTTITPNSLVSVAQLTKP
jgi:hypothetical protein